MAAAESMETIMQTESSAQGDVPAGAGHRRLISADRVQGSTVYDKAGEKLGHIEDVMLDKASGRVAYAIMSYGGFLGAGERYHPLPWSMLSYDTARNGYVVPLSRDQLDNAPTLGRDQVNEQDDSAWAEQVHTHYGLPGPFI
jgi:sporulation protein YlmC with PRC-barrel domain